MKDFEVRPTQDPVGFAPPTLLPEKLLVASAILPRVKDPQDEYIGVGQLIAKLVISNQDTTNFARIEL